MDKPQHQSDSTVQQRAEKVIVESLAEQLGLELVLKPPRVTISGGAWVEVDARSADGTVFVEAYARQGQLRGAQLKKIGQDVLKLALLRQEAQHADARAIIAFASAEARDSVRGWLRRAAQAFGVELAVVPIPNELRDQIVRAQGRQVMVNVEVTPTDLAEDLDVSASE